MKCFKELVFYYLSCQWSQEHKEFQVYRFRVSEQEGVPSLFVQLSHFAGLETEAPKDKASDRSSFPAFQAWASVITLCCLPGMGKSTEHGYECVGPLALVFTNDGTTKLAKKSICV